MKTKVKVYDRYRFSVPVYGILQKESGRKDEGEGVCVKLFTTTNPQYLIGSEIWVHGLQCAQVGDSEWMDRCGYGNEGQDDVEENPWKPAQSEATGLPDGKTFFSDHEIGEKIRLISGECGEVIGVCFYEESPTQYQVRYIAGDGRLVEGWWSDAAIAPPAI